MVEFVIPHQLLDSKTGRTYKEGNLAQPHSIPIGALVEFAPNEDFIVEDAEAGLDLDQRGIRLHVIAHTRDCDGSPLYVLGIMGDRWTGLDGSLGNRCYGGYSEGSLRVVDS